jgi:hypothetical protein
MAAAECAAPESRKLARVSSEAYDSAVALERQFAGLLNGLSMGAGGDGRVFLASVAGAGDRFMSAFAGAPAGWTGWTS